MLGQKTPSLEAGFGSCEICGYTDITALQIAEHLTYDVCRNCYVCRKQSKKSAQQDFALSQNAYYEQADEDPFAEQQALMRERMARRAGVMRDFLKEGTSVLEIGPGGGQVAQWLMEQECRYLGCEISMELAKKLSVRNIPVVHGDFEKLDFAESYDLLLSFHTIEHIPRPELQLEKALSIAKPGGCFIIATPNARSWEQRLFPSLSANFDVGHLHVFSPKSLKILAEKAGWSVHSFRTSEYSSDWLRIVSKVLRRCRGEDEVASAGKYSKMATSGVVEWAIAAIAAFTFPFRKAQAMLQGGNEIVLVLQKPSES